MVPNGEGASDDLLATTASGQGGWQSRLSFAPADALMPSDMTMDLATSRRDVQETRHVTPTRSEPPTANPNDFPPIGSKRRV
jgi:hypothetical protein